MLSNSSFPLLEPLLPLTRGIFRASKLMTTLLSVSSALLTIIVVIKALKKTNREYSILQLIVITLGLLNDVIAQLVFDPLFLLPLPCVTRNDALLWIPGSAKIHYFVWLIVVAEQAPAYIACFIHRHQAVLPPNSRWNFQRLTKYSFLSAYCIILIAPAIILTRAFLPHEAVYEFAQFLSPQWPIDLLDRTECSSVELVKPFIASSAILHVTSVSIVIALISHTFRLLRRSNIHSERRRIHQRTMTQILVMQTIFPILIQVLPNFAGFTVFFLGWNGILVWPVIMVILSTNSFGHSIVVLWTTPIYRSLIRGRIRKIVGLNRNGTQTVVTHIRRPFSDIEI